MKKFFQSLQVKLVIIITLFSLVPLLLTSIFFINRTENSIIEEQKKSVNRQLALVNDNTDLVFNDLLNNVSGLANSVLVKRADNTLTSYMSSSGTVSMTPSENGRIEQEIFNSFKVFGETHPQYQYVYMGTERGGYIQYPEGNMDGPYDPRQRPWYPIATNNPDDAVLGAPYYFATDDVVSVSGSQAIKDGDGNIIGVMALDVSLDSITSLFEDVSEDFYGYFMLIDNDGTIIADPSNKEHNFNNITEAYDDHFADLVGSKADFTEYMINNQPYLIKTFHSDSTGWNYVAVVDKDAMLSQLNLLEQVIIITILVVAGLATLFGYIVSRQIANPIKAVVKSADKVADGDFNVDINITATGETGLLINSFKRIGKTLATYQSYIEEIASVLNQIADGNMAFKLKSDYMGEFSKIKTSLLNISNTLTQTLMQIQTASDEIAVGSDQISAGAETLAQGATEQAASIEEFSASMAEISEKTRHNATRASEANTLSQQMGGEIQICNSKMDKMTDAMSDISNKSNQISNIIKTIEDIAFQTNILALNAAVEAARAGQAGKGFAVVAGEVKNLAQKSAEAAKDTTALIESTIEAVGNGDKITEETAKSLKLASDLSERTSQLIIDIANASQEQASGIEQITTAIEQISIVVQTNSSTAEESFAASEDLSSQSNMMRKLVNKFKLLKHTQDDSTQ